MQSLKVDCSTYLYLLQHERYEENLSFTPLNNFANYNKKKHRNLHVWTPFPLPLGISNDLLTKIFNTLGFKWPMEKVKEGLWGRKVGTQISELNVEVTVFKK